MSACNEMFMSENEMLLSEQKYDLLVSLLKYLTFFRSSFEKTTSSKNIEGRIILTNSIQV
jgi:hypothetical protein